MIIQTSIKSYETFNKIINEVLGGLQYSVGVGSGSSLVSLDEHLELTVVSTGNLISAKELIDIMGVDTFKRMMEYVLDPTYYHGSLNGVLRASSIVRRGFSWNATPEGWGFWEDVANLIDRIHR